MNSTPLAGPVAPPFSVIKKQITKFEQAEHVHRQLLYDLMSSIYEYLLLLTSNAKNNNEIAATTESGFRANEAHTSTQDNNRLTPNVESLLLHIQSCLEQIFLNGLRIFKPDVSILRFVLRFLRSIASSNLHLNIAKKKSKKSERK